MGSAGIGGLIAHALFWVLLVAGWVRGDLGSTRIAIFLGLWVGGLFGLPLVPFGDAFFMPFVALLDVSLVFLVFKGDVRIT